MSCCKRTQLCVFADTSALAIAAVNYLRALDYNEKWHVGYVVGKSKLTPYPMHTVSHLCTAALTVELAEFMQPELDVELQAVRFFTDSCIMQGYIHNSSQRFYTYVANPGACIQSSTEPKQWQFVLIDENPADHGTRPVPAAHLVSSSWLLGHPFLSQLSTGQDDEAESFELVQPDTDKDVRPQVTSLERSQSFFLVFSLWNVTTLWIRGGAVESKRWAVIFACLSTRAIHLKVIELMSTPSFISALRCFLSIQGPVKHLRSDRPRLTQ